MRIVSALLLALLALRPVGVAADDAVTAPALSPAPAAMSEAEIQRRLAFIDTTLEERDTYAKFWRYGWMTVFAAGAVGGAVLGTIATDDDVRNDSYVGAATSLLGVSGMIITKVDSGANLQALHAYSAHSTDSAAKLQNAERLLKATAEGEVYGRGWQEYAQSYAVSIGSGLLMWLYFEQPASFWIKTGTGAVFSTARVQTTPRAATRAWEAYQRDGGRTQPVAALGGEPGLGFAFAPGLAMASYRF